MGVSDNEDQESRDRDITCILLALFGWKKTDGDELECSECGRSVGLWNYSGELRSFVVEY